MRRFIQLVTVALLAAGGVLMTQTAASAAVTCQPRYYINVPGGQAYIDECYRYGTQVRVSGGVSDSDADGRCAQVYATYNNYGGTDYSPRACPEGDFDSFTFPWRAGTNAFVYLRTV